VSASPSPRFVADVRNATRVPSALIVGPNTAPLASTPPAPSARPTIVVVPAFRSRT
jgi:hypothetical protein